MSLTPPDPDEQDLVSVEGAVTTATNTDHKRVKALAKCEDCRRRKIKVRLTSYLPGCDQSDVYFSWTVLRT